MNEPKCVTQRNEGPIPHGSYTADIAQLSNPGLLNDLGRNYLVGDWGDWRVPLIPAPGTNALDKTGVSRSRFFLHGGSFVGSAGCIDIGGAILGSRVTDRVLRDLLADPDKKVPLIVR